jgi:hypothetical protein
LTDQALGCQCGCKCERDRHLFCAGPKRILALDGGGVRGAIAVAFLERIEQVLAERLKQPVVLGHWFDLIGGTSTGAIIAGALAMGFTTKDIKRFYFELAPKVFRHPFWRVIGLQAKFDAAALRQEIADIVGTCTLGGEDLITGFALVTKRMDTGSPWLLANNSRSPFWDGKAADPSTGDPGYIGNKDYPLVNLVRASTAAPLYFDPERMPIVSADGASGVEGTFVDGGVTPHNNPSLQLLLMALMNAYRLRWRAGVDNLTIVSIGTGSHRNRTPDEQGIWRTTRLAYRALLSLLTDIHWFVLTQMQYLGESLTPWWINSELKDEADEVPPGGKMFRFMRYDVQLNIEWLKRVDLWDEVTNAFGRELTEVDMIRMRSLDDPTIIEDIYKLAHIAALRQVKAEHWLGDMPTWCNGARPCAAARALPEAVPVAPDTSLRYRLSKQISGGLSTLRSRMIYLRTLRERLKRPAR